MNPNSLPKTKLTFLGEPDFDKVFSGISKLTRAVGMSLGPRSRAALMHTGLMWKINKDGVSIAKSIILQDPVEQAAGDVVREAAQKTVDEVGDGTSVTMILAQAFIDHCRNRVNNGTSPMALRLELEQELAKLLPKLDAMSTPIKSLKDKINVATISASGDSQLGNLIATTIEEIGVDGVLTVEESKDLETKVEKQEGMQLENGWSHPLFINNPERMSAIYENVPVLVTNHTLINLQSFAPLLDKIAAQSKSLIIIAPEVAMDIMEVLLQNKLKGNFFSLVIKAPGVGENRNEVLRDICALTGAKCISYEAGDKFEEVELNDLGTIERIVATKQSTIITGKSYQEKAIKERISMIKAQMEDETISEWEQEKLKERLGKLTNGIAVIKVGGATEVEMQERKERALDAVAATQAAIREGIVPGGEVALLSLRQETSNPIFEQVLQAPFKQLLTNSGLEPLEYRHLLSGNDGVDVTDGKIKDLIKAGIIDPVAVVKAALRNSLSVAIQIMVLGAVITLIPEEKK